MKRSGVGIGVWAAVLMMLAATGPVAAADLPDGLFVPVDAWVEKLTKESKNADGQATKKAVYSKTPRQVDDSSWEVSLHVNTAEADRQVTERYAIPVQKNAQGKWALGEPKVVDTYVGLFRNVGMSCYPFERFDFDQEGLKLVAGAGTVCERYLDGEVVNFAVRADKLDYKYEPPARAIVTGGTGHDFYAQYKLLARDHSQELEFDAVAFAFSCDPRTCEDLLTKRFVGLTRGAPDERAAATLEGGRGQSWIAPLLDRTRKERQENAFAHFRAKDYPGNRHYQVLVARDLEPVTYGFLDEALPGSGIYLEYDNFASWEVVFGVIPRRADIAGQLEGDIYGYYTEETAKTTAPHELELRDDEDTRWHEVFSLSGTVEAGLEDPEVLKADLDFGITLKQELQELPFFIANIPDEGLAGNDRRATLSINSIQLDGQELTWIKIGRASGRVILPRQMPAGTKIHLKMSYSTRAIVKINHAFNLFTRFGWMPFVSFGDFIDDFEMTIKVPGQYQVLGVGKKISEKREGDTLVSFWKSDSPVVFPTIIYGKYVSDKPRFDAKKFDGTVVPVAVHVDEVSLATLGAQTNTIIEYSDLQKLDRAVDDLNSGARGIRTNQLQAIAEQAANSINLYRELSGLDYPYGELNLVNDPAPAMYGQAPSSLIYLGSLVFRGEGEMAGGGSLLSGRGGGTRSAKFLKSVTAHEVGHQWWGSRVSNSNNKNYWFVETLAEYFSALFLETVYGKKEYQDQLDEWRQNILNSELKVSVQNASSLWGGEDGGLSYQSAVYSKGPYMFHMLRQIFGDEKFFPFLKKFSQELAAKREIVSRDIQLAAEKGLGGVGPDGQPYNVDLEWFFDQWLRGSGLPQYRLVYDVREAEGGGYIVEGKVEQRVSIGSRLSKEVVPGRFYRGVLDLTVQGKSQEYKKRLILDGPSTSFLVKVPEKPLDVKVNKYGEALSHEVLVNTSW